MFVVVSTIILFVCVFLCYECTCLCLCYISVQIVKRYSVNIILKREVCYHISRFYVLGYVCVAPRCSCCSFVFVLWLMCLAWFWFVARIFFVGRFVNFQDQYKLPLFSNIKKRGIHP